MKKLLLFCLVIAAAQAQILLPILTDRHHSAGGGINGFTHARPLVIDHTKVGGSLTDFTAPIVKTIANLKSTGNGGSVTDAQGDDIVFTSDSGCATPLSGWKLTAWDATTGAFIARVKVPSLSASVDTTIYVCYGKAAITTFQGGSAGAAFDSSYLGDWELPDGTTVSLSDSTSHANTLDNDSGVFPMLPSAGKVDGGGDTNSAQAAFKTTANITLTNVTFGGWFNLDSTVGTYFLIGKGTNTDFQLYFYSTDIHLVGGGFGSIITVSGMSGSAWHHIIGTITGTSGVLYIDGAAHTGTVDAIMGTTDIMGFGATSGFAFGMPGKMDELFVTNDIKPQAWVTTLYNSENDPASFITVGAEI